MFSNSQGIQITVSHNGKTEVLSGIEPFVDENWNFTGIIGVYTKSGKITKKTSRFIRKYRKYYKFIFLSSSGPYFVKNYRKLYRKYDAVTSLDCSLIDWHMTNNVNISWSMYTRCAPLENGFFWEPKEQWDEEKVDFSLLTWYGNKNAKAWPDARKVVVGLCQRGYRGILVTQRGTKEDLIKDLSIKEFVEAGLLHVYNAEFSDGEFHDIMSNARVGIFPNRLDAFPKHIIECLLANKTIIISSKLLFGVQTLENLGADITKVCDFDSADIVDEIADFIDKSRKKRWEKTPRDKWLERYGLAQLSKIWAIEINRVFSTQYQRIYPMRYEKRFGREHIEEH